MFSCSLCTQKTQKKQQTHIDSDVGSLLDNSRLCEMAQQRKISIGQTQIHQIELLMY